MYVYTHTPTYIYVCVCVKLYIVRYNYGILHNMTYFVICYL